MKNWLEQLGNGLKKKEKEASDDVVVEETIRRKPPHRKGSNNDRENVTEATRIARHAQEIPPREQIVFEVVSGSDYGRRFFGITSEIKIGRQLENHIQLSDPKVSRFHSVIYNQDSKLTIEDLQSTNGSRVNGELITGKKELVSGDILKIGETEIRVDITK